MASPLTVNGSQTMKKFLLNTLSLALAVVASVVALSFLQPTQVGAQDGSLKMNLRVRGGLKTIDVVKTTYDFKVESGQTVQECTAFDILNKGAFDVYVNPDVPGAEPTVAGDNQFYIPAGDTHSAGPFNFAYSKFEAIADGGASDIWIECISYKSY